MKVLNSLPIYGIVLIIIGGIFAIVALGLVLYFFVISKSSYKKQIKDISRKFSYLDALLVGQDSQYIHRLEIISRTNLLYVDKYELFSKRFKDVFENDDKYAESMIRQLNSLVAANQYKKMKQAISDTKKAVALFEKSVNELDRDLYEIIKQEEDSRQETLKLKEAYRRVKQTYYSNSSELELVSSSFNKVFDKLDASFAKIEDYIEAAEYEEVNNIIPTIQKVINALSNSLDYLPNLCSLIHDIIPQSIRKLHDHYKEVEKSGVPLFHLGYKIKEEEWKKTLVVLNGKINNLQTVGINAECERIQNEIERFYSLLDSEINDENEFNSNVDSIYNSVLDLEKNFLRLCSILPEITKIYQFEEEENERFEKLRQDINRLGESRRILDGFIHSGTKQPYSCLKAKLEELKKDYEISLTGVKEFKAYINSLKSTAEEAFEMAHVYYFHNKQIEEYLRELNIPEFTDKYKEEIDHIYNTIDELNKVIKAKPIDIKKVRDAAESLKSFANSIFEEIESKYRSAQLAESAIVYANRDRNHQNDVHQELTQLEGLFYKGEFEKVYSDANEIYRRAHIDVNENAK